MQFIILNFVLRLTTLIQRLQIGCDTICLTRMVVHGQLVEPAVCLSDLYDVFLLDIDRDTRQNLWTMIYRSQGPPNSMRSLTMSD